jgi:hypothetical protein
MKFAFTQLFTFGTVGFSPTQRRRTSVSHAARRAGVTSGGSLNSSANAVPAEAASALAATIILTLIEITLAFMFLPRENHGDGVQKRQNR